MSDPAAVRVAYLGPAGTFSEEALRASARGAVEPVAVRTLHDAVLAVQRREVERAVVPIENAVEGSVDATLDTLALAAPDVVILAEVVLPVRHHLLAAQGTRLEDVRAVVSHPQAAGQCAAFLRDRLGAVDVIAASSTADAARAVASDAGAGRAAIGTQRAAELYGCEVLAEGIEDHPGNETRFVWLAPAGTELEAPATRTSLVFWGAGAAGPGWLVRCLSEFAFRGVNLTRIESRPRREALGNYMFFVDVEGAAASAEVAGAVEGLRAHCDHVRVLGSFPSLGRPGAG